ncbi:MAG TPA: glycosyltransferase [Candidatus Kapabacteria bacterium]
MSNENNEPLETPAEREAEGTNQAPVRDIIAERMAARMANQPKREPRAEPMKIEPKSEADDSSEDEPTMTEKLRDEAEREEVLVEEIGGAPIVTEVRERPVLKLKSELEKSTEAMEASPEDIPKTEAVEESEAEGDETQSEGGGDKPRRKSQRERQREKQMQRRAERDARNAAKGAEPAAETTQTSLAFKAEAPAPTPEVREERPARKQLERAERPERAERTERPERKERNDRPERQRPDKPREDRGPKLENRQRPDQAANRPGGSNFTRAKGLASRLGVSVVIPLYNEQDSLRELTAAIREELFKLCDKNYEIIYVNDGSNDRSAEILKDLVAGSSRIISLTFRRNVGKSPALAVGFKEAKYGIVITMDADLQDDPKEMINLIAKLDEGHDLVTGWKKKRNDPASKTVPSKFFNMVTSFFSGIKLHDFNCGLKAYRKEVTEALEVYGELHRYLPALAHWKGFRVAEIPVTHHPRKFGKSKFGTSRFFKGFLDLLSIVFVNRYGKRPLHLFGTVGTLLAILGLGINTYVTIEWFGGIALSNRPILLLGVLLILVGVQLISLGLLGEMIVKNSGKTLEAGYIRDKRAGIKRDPSSSRR